MPRHTEAWSWVVLFFVVLGYVPLAIGGWQHPKEMNIAVYSLWVILASMMTYSTKKQGFSWKMPLGWTLGNVFMVIFAFLRGGCTFNLGPAEAAALYGIVVTLAVWIAVGTVTKKGSPRILLLGSIAADIATVPT